MERTSLALKLVRISYGLPDDVSITLKHLAEKIVESTNTLLCQLYFIFNLFHYSQMGCRN